jgi:outer membrane protein assembly factor BamB
MRCLCILLGLGLITGFAPAADWTQFRGPEGSGVSSESGLPIRWGPAQNIRWKVDLPGRGLSSPVVAGGRVYLTACTGFDQDRLHVLCLDEATGKELWHRQFWATGVTVCHPKTCMAAPTPATDGRRVYALFATGDLVCLDADGNLRWCRSLTRDYPAVGNNVGMASSPVLSDHCLILVMENAGPCFALGVDKLTGKNRWKVNRPQGINWVSPLLYDHAGRREVVFQSQQDVSAHDPETGRRLWHHATSGLSTIVSPVFAGGLIYVPGGRLVALRPAGNGTAAQEVWQSPKLQTSFASPLVYRGRLYVVNPVGVLNCADAATGKVQWQLRVKGPFSASPLAADGHIYVVNETGTTTIIKVGDTGKLVATNDLPETILASPVAANGAIYLRSDQRLYCIGGKKQ